MTAGVAAELPASPWLRRAFQEVCRHRHLILHGAIDDLVRWNYEYAAFTPAVEGFMRHLGFELVVTYDPVDGLAFSSDQERESFFRSLPSAEGAPENPAAAEPPPAAGAPLPQSDRQRQLEETRSQMLQSVRSSRRAELRDPADALAGIRTVLSDPAHPCAVLLDFADLVIGTEAPPDANYRDHLIQLGKIMRSAASVDTHAGQRRNTLVLITRRLSTIPGWLYTDNPTIAPVLVEKPGAAERAAFVFDRRGSFFGGATDDRAARDAASAIANLSEGMSIRDLIALSATSQVSSIPMISAKRLILHHRFGLRQDPWEQLDTQRVASAEQYLSKRVMGQPEAVRRVAEMLVNANVGLDFVRDEESASTRPKGVFFFVGPTGVGKTELAKTIAEFVFDDEAALRRFDMSEFGEPHSAERLTGAPPGYVGHDAGGVLTNWVLEHPFSVVLFDEIEKADPKIFDKFLQIIDDGRLTDGQGRTAFFSHTVVVFTSNQGSPKLYELLGEGRRLPLYSQVHDLYTEAVEQFFSNNLGRPELLGRLGRGIVVFDILRDEILSSIAEKFLQQLRASARGKGFVLVFDEGPIIDLVVGRATRTGLRLGARQIRDPILEEVVRAPLNRWILERRPEPGARILVRVRDDNHGISITDMPSAAA
jgi:hypothetical protein